MSAEEAPPYGLASARMRAGDVFHAALVLSAFALFVAENLVHYPVALMGLLGLVFMVRREPAPGPGAARTLLLLFGCIWLPMLAALVDAVDMRHSAKTVLLYLHFLPAAWYLACVCARPAVHRLVVQGVVALVVFAGLDAFVQLIWKVDLFGYPYDGRVLKGVFHPKQRLGLFLAVFAPLVLEIVRQWCRSFPRLWLLHVPLAIVILMSLKRSAWLMLAVGVAGYLVLLARGGARRAPRWWHVIVVLVVVGGAVAVNPALRGQLMRSVELVSADVEAIDRASSYRVTLWRTGSAMFLDNWLNGVGPRGYRHAYPAHAAPDDFWMERNDGEGQTHPHLLMLEVAAESGIIGLAGLFAFYAVLLHLAWRVRAAPLAPVWLTCVLVAWFPFNAHLAFYGSYWSTLAWLLLGMGLSALPPRIVPRD
ncbi:MAG: O-antigen ligase family protein [Gammaproteobacteria bacterium]